MNNKRSSPSTTGGDLINGDKHVTTKLEITHDIPSTQHLIDAPPLPEDNDS